jgi:signal peptidase I
MPKAKAVKRGLSILLATLLALPLLLSLFGVISVRSVLTNSMSPKIQPGDLVVSANWIKPTLGDVAIYHQRDFAGTIRQDVVHRVITIDALGEYQFKGDNNQSMDALSVPKDDVVGTVVLKLSLIGKFLNLLGLLTFGLIIGGIYLVGYGIRALTKN